MKIITLVAINQVNYTFCHKIIKTNKWGQHCQHLCNVKFPIFPSECPKDQILLRCQQPWEPVLINILIIRKA